MNTLNSVVILGGGQAGISCATALRRRGWLGSVSIISDEPVPPYERPPLSKKVLTGHIDPTTLTISDKSTLEQANIGLITGSVNKLDRVNRELRLDDDRVIAYDHLVLATGASARMLPPSIPGSEAKGIHVIRKITDAESIRDSLSDAHHICVIGGGFIGVEVAAALNAIGKNVTVLEATPRILNRVAPTALSDWVTDHLQNSGVTIALESSASRFEVDEHNRVSAVIDQNGTAHPADLVVVGIGALANTDVAADAGLEIDRAVVVDEYLLTNDGAISAIGDCAVQYRRNGTLHRPESVQAAQDQGRYVAHRILNPTDHPYDAVPWFWSDIGSARVQMAGAIGTATTIIRRPTDDDKLSLFGFINDELIGVATVNKTKDYMAGRVLLENRIPLTPEMAADPEFDIHGYARAKQSH